MRQENNNSLKSKEKQAGTVIAGRGKQQSVRLNKFIANAGLCSRREADRLIASGRIKVNGKVVHELGVKINPRQDKIQYGSKLLSSEKKVYVLLNKPKDCITTTKDKHGRMTVMDIIRHACRERIYPVGRLDRNTTGLLLLTNDGELAKKLTHPSGRVRKVYEVKTKEPLRPEELKKITSGILLDKDLVKADVARYVGDASDKTLIGIELHSGKNRVIRRMFEAIGHEIVRLDRVALGGLTKKNLHRGRWRHLTKKEIGMLKMTCVGPHASGGS